MCKTKKDTLASAPTPKPKQTPRTPRFSETVTSSSSAPTSVPTDTDTRNRTTQSSSSSSSASSAASASSLASLRDSLPEQPTLYPFHEISSATNYFLAKRLSSSSSSSWRCSLRGKDTVVFQRSFHGDPSSLPNRLSAVCKSHNTSLVKLLGASLGSDHIYLVYEYVAGANLADCLRNPRNPNFTPLASWISRMQVATDLAQGIEYMHHHSTTGDHRSRRGTIHNRIKSSSVIVTEPQFRAKICHFGSAELAGDIPTEEARKIGEITEISSPSAKLRRRSDSREMKIDGTRGYIAPEVLAGGSISQKSDVYAFGVVLLELLSGEEPVKYRFDRERREYEMVSLIARAREAIGSEAETAAAAAEERSGRIRRWVDRRLRDSFPVEVAEKLIRVGMRCVEEEAGKRPDMVWVSGKVSKLFLESRAWGERVRVPTDFSVSLAPR